MRILRACPFFYWPVRKGTQRNNISGSHIQTYRLTMAMDHAGIKQSVYTILSEPIIPAEKGISVKGERAKNHSPFLYLRWIIKCVHHVKQMQKKESGYYDLAQVHCTGGLSPLLLGLILKKRTKIPVVFSMFCCRQTTYIERYKIELLFRKIVHRFERYCFSVADALIFPSHRSVKKILEMDRSLDPNRLFVIGDIIDPDSFRQENPQKSKLELMQRYHIPENKQILLYVGRIASEKGWNVFLDIANELRNQNCFFIMCGGGPQEDKLLQKIEKLNLTQQVVWTGFISNQDVSTMMEFSDVLILPSQYEEFGSLVLEAGIQKLPVVATEMRSMVSLLENGRGLLAPYGDYKAFAGKVSYLLTHPQEVQVQADKLYDFINEHFLAEVVAEKYMEVFRFVLQSI